MPNNIIDSIRLSGTTYQIQGSGGGITVDPTLDSGSTNPVANSAITAALGDKVNVVDNNVSAYTFEDKIGDAQHEYSEHFAGPIYIRYTSSTSSSGNYYAGTMTYYISESASEPIDLYFNLSNGQITATTTSSAYFDIEIENGEAAITFKDGYYLRRYYSQNNFVALTKTTYESGQSADVIEDTVYDVFDKLNDKIDKTGDNAVTGGSISFSDGYLYSFLYSKDGNTASSIKIDSSTIKSSNDGLSVQFANSEVADRILNLGSGSYGTLFSTDSYDTSFNEFTITFNPNCTQYGVYNFSVRIIDASNAMYDVTFEYDSSDMSAVYTDLNTYCTVTDTLPTDYKLKVTAKEGYKIARLYSSNYMVGGVDNTTPNNYISNLVTTPSYVHDGQDVIDDIYDKLDDKQDTLVSSQNIKTINNQSLLGSGNIDIQGGGGGKAVTGGTNISVTTGETADTINCTLPMSTDSVKKIVVDSNYSSFVTSDAVITANSLSNSILLGNNTFKIKGIIKGNINNNLIIGSYNTSELRNGTSPTLEGNLVVGSNNTINGFSSLLVGSNNTISRSYQFAIGYKQHPNNEYETSLGAYSVSSSGSSTFGDSGNTLFSVGNGTSESARHNAFEVRQNGDIYITLNGQDVKLQDQLGGGGSSYTAGDGIDITNDVISVTGKVDTSTYNTYTAATDTALASKADTATTYTKTEVDTALASKQTTLTAGTGISIVDNVISATGGGGGGLTEDDELLLSTALTDLNDRKIDASEVKSNYQKKGDYVTTSTLNTRLAEYETALDEQNVEEVTAYALNDLNERFGGLKIVKITESEYAALTTKDENTLYIVVADPS